MLVGDPDQLPPVGPGQPVADALAEGLLPCIDLRQIYRTAANSRIVTSAHAINRGGELAGSVGYLTSMGVSWVPWVTAEGLQTVLTQCHDGKVFELLPEPQSHRLRLSSICDATCAPRYKKGGPSILT